MLLIPAQLLSEWYTCCCTRKQIRLTNSVCIYKCIPIFIQMYIHIRAPTWPSKHPCTPMHTHTHTHMTAHKTVLLTCGLHISEVMYRNHISLLYFVIRFFKVFNMVRVFFSHNSFHDVNCTLHMCTWCSPIALCAWFSKYAFSYTEIACEYHIPIQQMGNLRNWDILWSQYSVREWQGRNNKLKQSWVSIQWFSQ